MKTITITEDQLNDLNNKIASLAGRIEALKDTFAEVTGTKVPEDHTERMKARIVAALERADIYIKTNKHLEPILKYKALTKTLLRRALGGNVVKMDEAMDELIQTGKVIYHPECRVIHGIVLQVYELDKPVQPEEPEMDPEEKKRIEMEKAAAEDKRMRDIWEQAWSGYRMIPDVTLEEQLASMTPDEKRALRTGNFGPEKK